jgi:hypothetical protein
VRGSVFNNKFRLLSGEFGSVETFPGFARLLRKKLGLRSLKSALFKKKC